MLMDWFLVSPGHEHPWYWLWNWNVVVFCGRESQKPVTMQYWGRIENTIYFCFLKWIKYIQLKITSAFGRFQYTNAFLAQQKIRGSHRGDVTAERLSNLHDENSYILVKPYLLWIFVPKGPNNNQAALFLIMAWCRTDYEPFCVLIYLVCWCIYASLGLTELIHMSYNIIV